MGYPIGQELTFRYEYDFAQEGGATGTISLRALGNDLPADVSIEKVSIHAESELTSSGTPTVTFGWTGDPDGFATDKWSVLSVAEGLVSQDPAVAPLDFNGDAVVMDVGSAALTGGKLQMVIECVRLK